jgi:hypothetical protein
MQRLYAALHGTLDSYLRDALHEGSVDAVAYLLVPLLVTLMSACNILFVDMLCFLSTFLGRSAARIHATSLCCSSWYFGFLSSRRFA